MKLKINEIYKSIQGESTLSGLPCTFIRLTYCNLRCSYCDTEYAFYDGDDISIKNIIAQVNDLKCKLVLVTGGEPLVQDGCIELLKKLIENGNNTVIETGGALSIDKIPKKTKIIYDIKCPSSNMSDKNLWHNLKLLKKDDEIKFVIGTKEDYIWSKKIIKKHKLDTICSILISPVYNKIDSKKIVEWILKDNINVRFQMQMHKQIWEPDKKGV